FKLSAMISPPLKMMKPIIDNIVEISNQATVNVSFAQSERKSGIMRKNESSKRCLICPSIWIRGKIAERN
ncbi:MAG: hypothetical protein JSV68_16265, partial [Anaerolineaceae bacterium]